MRPANSVHFGLGVGLFDGVADKGGVAVDDVGELAVGEGEEEGGDDQVYSTVSNSILRVSEFI